MLLMKTHSLIDLNIIAQTIFDKKGFNILVLDLKGISSLTDYVVIAEGQASTHVQALAQAVIDRMALSGYKPAHVEGKQEGDWIVLDFSHFIVHLFQPGWRDKYQLEQLWRKAEIVDVQIDIGPVKDAPRMK